MTKVQLELLTNISMLILTESGLCHSFCLYAKMNNKYMKNYNPFKQSSSYLTHLGIDN